MSEFIDIQTNMETVEAILELLSMAGVSPSHPDLITSSDIIQSVIVIRDKLDNPAQMAMVGASAEANTNNETFGLFGNFGGDSGGEDSTGLLANLSSFLDGGGPSGDDEDPDAPFYSNTRQVAQHKRILILSNLGIVTYQLKRILASKGLEVTIAKDLQEAVFEFNRRPYTGVVIDLFMPKAEQGLSALASMRKAASDKDKTIDIVMLASPQGDGEDEDSDIDYRPVVMKQGAQGFVIKRSDWYDEVLHFYTRAM